MLVAILITYWEEEMRFRYEEISESWTDVDRAVRGNGEIAGHFGDSVSLFIGTTFRDTVFYKRDASALRKGVITYSLVAAAGVGLMGIGGCIYFLFPENRSTNNFFKSPMPWLIAGGALLAGSLIRLSKGFDAYVGDEDLKYIVSVEAKRDGDMGYLEIRTDYYYALLFLAGKFEYDPKEDDWRLKKFTHGMWKSQERMFRKSNMKYDSVVTRISSKGLVKNKKPGVWIIPMHKAGRNIYKLYTPGAAYEITYMGDKVAVLKIRKRFKKLF